MTIHTNTLFLDIETVPEYPTLSELPEAGQIAFKKKFGPRVASGQYGNFDEAYEAEAGLHAEFSKIVCIGIGSVTLQKSDGGEANYIMHVKGLIGTEKEILEAFVAAIEKANPSRICAHNGMAFDFPFICRRMLINRMALPNILNIGTKKPWEVAWDDTAVMWKFADFKSYTSLITLCYVFGVESPKQEIDGSQVAQAFLDGKIQTIKKYCMQDVRALIEVYRGINQLPTVTEIIYHE